LNGFLNKFDLITVILISPMDPYLQALKLFSHNTLTLHS
ncbi:unnamed protein product, partial [marine sediment metagenome]